MSVDEVRQIRVDDADGLVSLHIAAFGNRDNSREDLTQFYGKVLDRALAADFGLRRPPSLARVKDGQIIAAVIAAAIPMVFDGEPISGAVATLLASHPDHRQGRTVQKMLGECFHGDQDFTFADRVNSLGRRAGEQSGMDFYGQYSLRWSRLVAPGKAAVASLLHRSRLGRASGAAARVASNAVDRLAPRLLGERLTFAAPSVRLDIRELTAPDLAAQGDSLLADFRLRPNLSSPEIITAQWDWLSSVRTAGTHHRIGVFSPGGDLLGWYLLHVSPTGTGEVVQLVSTPRQSKSVLAQLFHHAEQLGVGSLHGVASPAMLIPLGDAGTHFTSRNSSTGFHSLNSDMNEAMRGGEAYFSGLEGEYPLQLARGNGRR